MRWWKKYYAKCKHKKPNTYQLIVINTARKGITIEGRSYLHDCLILKPTVCTTNGMTVSKIVLGLSTTQPLTQPTPQPTGTGKAVSLVEVWCYSNTTMETGIFTK